MEILYFNDVNSLVEHIAVNFKLHNLGAFIDLKLKNTVDLSAFSKVAYLSTTESEKNWTTTEKILKQVMAWNLDRNSMLVAIGGGVLSDLVGFVASIYMRGISWIGVPTTLLSQVDAAIGGKTGCNFLGYKNLIGSFHASNVTLICPKFLDSLSDREYRAGLAEVVKYGLAFDKDFFNFLYNNIAGINTRDPKILTYIIKVSCKHKLAVVTCDPLEYGERILLNLGHTFAHALESMTNFNYLHGEAVAIGLYLAVTLSKLKGYISVDVVSKLKYLLLELNLPILACKLDVNKFLIVMAKDKKVVAGKFRIILLDKLGSAFVDHSVKLKDLENLLNGNQLC